MKKTAESLKQEIKESEDKILLLNNKILSLKKRLTEMESDLITASLAKARAKEELRLYLTVTVSPEFSARELEIEEFRKKYPDLCDKNKNEKN